MRWTAVAVLATSAAGVAALTAAFAMLDAAVFRDPPFPGAGRLAVPFTTHRSVAEPLHNERWSYRRVELLATRARSFSAVANYSPATVTLTGSMATESVRGELVSASYFTVLGVGPLIGRALLATETEAVGSPVVIVSHDLWQRRYGAAPDIVGRVIGVNGVQLTVVGVMPRGFRGLTDAAQVWLPATLAPSLTYPEYLVTDQNFISAIARLRDEVSMASARAEVEALGTQIYAAIPASEPEPGAVGGATLVPLADARVHPVTRRAAYLLFGSVGLLFMLAVANVMNLLLGHAVAGRRDAAIRLAIGSTPRSLFAWQLGQNAILVATGGLAGAAIAAWVSGIVSLPTELWGPRNFYGSVGAFAGPALRWPVVSFGVALALGSSLVIAVVPALSALRLDLTRDLREGGRGASRAGAMWRRPSAQNVIVAAESTLAVVLLVAGGLLIDSFNRMRQTDLGVDARQVLTFSIMPPETRVTTAGAPAYISRLLDAITALPGVRSASVDGGAPVGGTARSTLLIVGRPNPDPSLAPPILRHYVGPDHFATLGIPLKRGRLFTDQDRAGAPHVAIISESAAHLFSPGADPIGQRVYFGGGSAFDRPDSSAEIVGIVGDVMYEPLDVNPNRASFYTPYLQFSYGWRIYFVRTAGDPALTVPAIRDAVHRVDPDVAVDDVQTLEARVGASWSRQRFEAGIVGSFAALALILAVGGVYAVVARAVAQRRREMGIRLALGSQPRDVVRLVLRQGLLFPAIGLVLGWAAALMAGGLLRSSLYGVGPADPRVFAVAISLLLLAAATACLIPARRAARVDPCETLRAD